MDSAKFGLICVKINPGESFSYFELGFYSEICFSVCAPFCPYNSKTITSINLKFGGKVFHGVQTDSSKFVVICLKIKPGESFSYF